MDSSGRVASRLASGHLTASRDETFPRSVRLRSKKGFERVFSANHVVVDRMLVINGAASELDCTRLGLSIPKRVGNAPQRNRWKRLIREAFRRQRGELPAGLDIVVRPRKGSSPNYEEVAQSLRKLVPLLAKQFQNR